MANVHQGTAIDEAFIAFCDSKKLIILARAIDNHGSVVWEAMQRDSLARYLTLAATETLVDGSHRVQMSIAIGADDGQRSMHVEQSSWDIPLGQFVSDSGDVADGAKVSKSPDQLREATTTDVVIRQRLDTAWKSALAVRREDLHTAFVVPRHSLEHDALAL